MGHGDARRSHFFLPASKIAVSCNYNDPGEKKNGGTGLDGGQKLGWKPSSEPRPLTATTHAAYPRVATMQLIRSLALVLPGGRARFGLDVGAGAGAPGGHGRAPQRRRTRLVTSGRRRVQARRHLRSRLPQKVQDVQHLLHPRRHRLLRPPVLPPRHPLLPRWPLLPIDGGLGAALRRKRLGRLRPRPGSWDDCRPLGSRCLPGEEGAVPAWALCFRGGFVGLGCQDGVPDVLVRVGTRLHVILGMQLIACHDTLR